jgi:hypothetical protein
MNFYIKKNSTLPKLSVEIIIDSEVSFRNTYDSFSASTITFNMKEKETGFYKIIGKSVTVKEKETTNNSPLKSFYLETQFTKKETSKLGTFLGEFKISNDSGTTILPISNEFVINIIDSFSDSDFCCRPNRGESPIVIPSETPKPSLTITPTPSITTTVTPTITPSTSNNCREYTFNSPNSPNTQVAEWQYVRCDGTFVSSHNQNPGESATMCLRIGTLTLLSGPGQSVQLGICSI